MKRTLLCLLLSAGTIFGNATALYAANPADTVTVTAPVDTVAAPTDTLTIAVIPTPAAAPQTDSLLQVLGDRISDIEQSVRQVRNYTYSHSGLNGENVMVVLIVALIATAVVLMTFFTLKFTYRKREKHYELERLRIERGEQLSVPQWNEMPVTQFIRRLLIVAIVAFAVLAWSGVVFYLRVFSTLLVWILIVAVGYAIVHLFRVYVQRRDDNR